MSEQSLDMGGYTPQPELKRLPFMNDLQIEVADTETGRTHEDDERAAEVWLGENVPLFTDDEGVDG